MQGIGTNFKNYANKLPNYNELLPMKNNFTSKQRLVFADAAYTDLSLQNPFSLTMYLKFCYDYATITQSTICVAKESNICSLEGNKIDENSNSIAPIKITSIKEKVEGNVLTLSFVIENIGKGKVYMSETNCDGIINENPLDITKENYVKIDINDGGIGLKCRILDDKLNSIEGLSGYVQLGSFICYKKITDENQLNLIRITTKYKYVDSTTKLLTVYPA